MVINTFPFLSDTKGQNGNGRLTEQRLSLGGHGFRLKSPTWSTAYVNRARFTRQFEQAKEVSP